MADHGAISFYFKTLFRIYNGISLLDLRVYKANVLTSCHQAVLTPAIEQSFLECKINLVRRAFLRVAVRNFPLSQIFPLVRNKGLNLEILTYFRSSLTFLPGRTWLCDQCFANLSWLESWISRVERVYNYIWGSYFWSLALLLSCCSIVSALGGILLSRGWRSWSLLTKIIVFLANLAECLDLCLLILVLLVLVYLELQKQGVFGLLRDIVFLVFHHRRVVLLDQTAVGLLRLGLQGSFNWCSLPVWVVVHLDAGLVAVIIRVGGWLSSDFIFRVVSGDGWRLVGLIFRCFRVELIWGVRLDIEFRASLTNRPAINWRLTNTVDLFWNIIARHVRLALGGALNLRIKVLTPRE